MHMFAPLLFVGPTEKRKTEPGSPLGPASRGREYLVDLERSEQIYLVTRDRFSVEKIV